jgi:quercetin dioxygenase-like cupin family protein
MTSEQTPGISDLLFVDGVVRISRHTLLPGSSTGVHTHDHDYVVVPLRGGTILVESGSEVTPFTMSRKEPYSRQSGVTHSLTNDSDTTIEFVELEYL